MPPNTALAAELADLRVEVAKIDGQVDTLLNIVKWGGAAATFLLVLQTVAIVVLAGHSLTASASTDGFVISGAEAAEP
jgi:hypothetical protein